MKERKIIEDKIKSIIEEEGNKITFQYDWVENTPGLGTLAYNRFEIKQLAEVIAFTTNSQTGEKFLLKRTVADTHTQALAKILEYLEHTKNNMSTFTVHWTRLENGNVTTYNTSYFYCHDIMEVVNKFFDGKNTRDYVIYDIKLNPVS